MQGKRARVGIAGARTVDMENEGGVVTRISLSVIVAMLLPAASLARAETVFTVTGGDTFPEEFVLSQVLFDTEDQVQGWSVGLCHDDANLAIDDAVLGADAATSNNGGIPGFVGLNTAPDGGAGVTLGVIVDLMGGDMLDPGTDIEILDVTYEVIGTTEDSTVVADVFFCDTLGDPIVTNSVVIGSESFVPIFEDSAWNIEPPPDFCIELSCQGGLDDASLDWTICTPFDYYTIHRDGEFLGLLEPETTSYFEDELAPGTYHYVIIGVGFPDPVGSPAVVVAECDVDVIPLVLTDFDPKVGPYAGGTTVTLTGLGFDGGGALIVRFGALDAEDVQIVDGQTATCVTPAVGFIGEVDVFVQHDLGQDTSDVQFLYGFIRGDFDEDGDVSIADPIVLLEYLFVGGPLPGCQDALDANDNGELEVADPIYVLQYLFALDPAPSAPFPDAGLDPTSDDLGCLDGP